MNTRPLLIFDLLYQYVCVGGAPLMAVAMDRQFCVRWWWLHICILSCIIIILVGILSPLWIFTDSRGSDSRSAMDGCDCRYQCEWQVVQMNKTFNFLMTACEEKVQKLHKSDMNMAIIREQLNKEMLELFLYEYQTMSQRLQNIKEESVPQVCSDYCITLGLSKCKKSITKLQSDYQRLSDRQYRLKVQLQSQRDLQKPGNICISQNNLIIVATTVILLGFIGGILILTRIQALTRRRRIMPASLIREAT